MDWFRSWHGAPTDNKWRVIAKKAGVSAGMVSAIVWALFDHASQNEDRGSIEGFDFETYSEFSGFDVTECHAVTKALCDKGVIHSQKFQNWEKRQVKKEDKTATERKRNQRLRDKSRNVTEDVTQSHGREEKNRVEEIRVEKESTLTPPPVKKTPLPNRRALGTSPRQQNMPEDIREEDAAFEQYWASLPQTNRLTKPEARLEWAGLGGALKSGRGEEAAAAPTRYNIVDKLSDSAHEKAKLLCKSLNRDFYHLAAIYDDGVTSGKRPPPKSPDSAFPAWISAYTKNERL